MSLMVDADAALGGALGIARGNPAAIARFPHSEPAFWRSFAAILFVAPVDLAITVLRTGEEATAGYLLADLVSTLIQWVAFPVLMIFVARMQNLGGRYALFIIAYNWSSILIIAALLPSALFAAVSAPGDSPAAAFSFATIMFVLWFATFLARTALATGWVTAIGIVLLDVLTSLFVNGLVFRLAGFG